MAGGAKPPGASDKGPSVAQRPVYPDYRPLYLNDKPVGEGRITKTVPFVFSADETLDIGGDLALPVTEDYPEGEDNKFSGKINWVRVDLEEAGVADDTIVVWASDNAAGLLQGHLFGSSGPWRGYFGGGWEGSIRAPAIAAWPGHIPKGVTTNEIVASYDWMPTLAALTGLGDRLPTDRPIDGLDMSSLLLGESDSSGRDTFVFLGTDGEVVSVKWKTMKVHFRYAQTDSWTTPLVKPQIPSVYDLFADPGETLNLMDADLTVSWVIRAAMAPLIELAQSAARYPHVPVGADFEGYE